MLRRTKFFALLALPLALLASACGPDMPAVDDAYVRLSGMENRPSAGYFTITAGNVDKVLVGVDSPEAEHIELHETVEQDGVATMRPAQKIAIPAGKAVTFAPGGKHLMIFGAAPDASKDGTIPLTAHFADGTRLDFTARLETLGGEPVHGE